MTGVVDQNVKSDGAGFQLFGQHRPPMFVRNVDDNLPVVAAGEVACSRLQRRSVSVDQP